MMVMGEHEKQSPLRTLLALVFTRPINVVSRRQSYLLVHLVDRLFDRTSKITATNAVFNRDIALFAFAINLFGAIIGGDLGKLCQRNTLACGRQQPHIFNSLTSVAIWLLITKHQIITSLVIVAQNVTNAAAAGVTFSGSATAFTIADLSRVWIICDVYENDIPKLQLGQAAQIRLNAYPDKVLTGRVSDIGPVLDPSIRTAKVRIEIPNPGILKLGMFVAATFASRNVEVHALVPTTAILHLHDRDWVFVPAGDGRFRRVEVHGGNTEFGNKLEILSGIAPGQQVVSNVLQLEATLEGQ